MEYWQIVLLIAVGVYGIYYLFKNFNFFKRNGIIHVPSLPIVGNMLPVFLRQMSFLEFMQKTYNFRPDAKYFGFYFMTKPTILLRDPELIKEIFVKNFDAFPDRRGFSDSNDLLFAKNLFSLKGQSWREMRNLLSPAFTSNKMKAMFALMAKCAEDFVVCMSTSLDENDVDAKDVFTKFANDVIATCAFGIKVDSMRNPTNQFFVYGKMATSFTGFRALKLFILQMFPYLSRIIPLKLIDSHILNFFRDIIETTIAIRDAKNITRPDMIQLMMDARGKRESERSFDIDDMTAQAFVFFFAGFDTMATVISLVAHQIAVNPDVQERLRQEIDAILEKTNGEITYEAVNRAEYLDAVINESNRLYPSNFFIERVCQKEFELPPALPGEKPYVIKKGMVILVPVCGIHLDEKYYKEPEKFRPERFLNGQTNYPYYLSFGIGPRMCIANRFALVEIKVLLCYLLATCVLKPCAKTNLTMKLSRNTLAIEPEGGFWLSIQRRNDMHPKIEARMLSGWNIHN